MNIFFNILQKCIKVKNISLPTKEFILESRIHKYDTEYKDISPYIYILIDEMNYLMTNINRLKNKRNANNNNSNDSIIENKYSLVSQIKLNTFKKLLDNIFISNELKEKIIDSFCKAQKIYYALGKFVNNYKYKKYNTVVSNDLTLNPLTRNDVNTFTLLQSKSIYLFSVNDLIHIIEIAICNAPNFFAEPMIPKNPYNNERFNTSTLYNIYFALKKNTRLMSILFHLFFLVEFNIDTFCDDNEAMLRQISIEKYVSNSPVSILHKATLTMINENFYTKQLNIHAEFPKDILVNIFRPFLLYYFIIHYDFHNEKKYTYKQILSLKLKKFYDYNKLFGRKITHVVSYRNNNAALFTSKNKYKLTYSFNTKHLSFYNICVNENRYSNNLYLHVDYNLRDNYASDDTNDNTSEDTSDDTSEDNDDNSIS